ncbi:coiled-coil domain-containing protein 80 [Aplochiton taeniatus]
MEDPSSSLAPELDFLADFDGKKRLWVITAPSHSDNYLRMMEKQLEDMEKDGLNCRLAERDTYIVTIIQNAMMEGKIQKTTIQDESTVESLDPDTVTKLLHYLELTNQDQSFSMLVTKKNLRVTERFPYPVRVEAVLEIIDQFPMRKLEKMTRKGSPLKCKPPKKKVLVKKKRKKVFSPLRQAGVKSVLPAQRKPAVDKKTALKSKIQDILSGRSRFVIRKKPAGSDKGSGLSPGTPGSNTLGEDKLKTGEDSRGKGPVSISRYDSSVENRGRKHTAGGDKSEEPTKTVEDQNKQRKKGKGKKKGKGRGKKSNREMTEKERKAMKEFVESLKGNRRLMLVSTPSTGAALYSQLTKENEKRHCDLAIRKITVATILGSSRDPTLTLQHPQLDSEVPFSDLPDRFTDPDMISQLRAEFGLSSPDLFSMTVTDYDLKPNRVFEAPPLNAALLDYVDNFPSRRAEREGERKAPPACSTTPQSSGAEDSLLRFMAKRRLLIISTPSEEDYSFQQQLRALSGQHCPMGVRHFALLKLIGAGAPATGSVEMFPLNGRSQSQMESLSGDVVNNLREQLKISRDFFSMLVVGKDGDTKAWFPSPMWSLESIYDLVDSMELRAQEEKLQQSLGISCPEDRGGGGVEEEGEEAGYRGYGEEGADDGYPYHRT